jgi:hypothetical protein
MQVNKLSFLLFFLCLSRATHQLDFFFFSKFYNDGVCKPIEELEKYMLKSKEATPKMNFLEPLLLTASDEPIVDFGLYLTSNQKAQLADAHAFFKDVYPALEDYQRVYFPDMVTCVTQIPFLSFFGLRDTYGLMYNLVPTLDENRENDLSGDDYTLTDLVDLYLDIFKALQVLIEHEYFMTDITADEVGIKMNAEDVNTHIRGKIRHLHNFRKGFKNCNVSNMSSYQKVVELMAKFDHDANPRDFHGLNGCQALNALDAWHLFIDSVTEFYNRKKKVFFSFNTCIQDMIDRHNQPQIQGAQGYCPEEISVTWDDINIRKGLRTLEQGAIKYTAQSMTSFYIYVLTRMKEQLMQGSVLSELKKYNQDQKQKEKIRKQIQMDKNKLSELERLEQEILNASVEKPSSRVMKDDSFQKKMEKMEMSPSLVEDQSVMNNSSDKKAFDPMSVFDEDTDKKIQEVEKEKKQVLDDEKANRAILEEDLEKKKNEILYKFKRITRKALINDRKEKLEKQAKLDELNEIKKKKIERREKIGKFKPNQTIDINNETIIDEAQDTKFNSKIIIDSNPVLKQQTPNKSESEKNESSEISDYQSNESNEDESSTNSNDPFTIQTDLLNDLRKEEMELNGIEIKSTNSETDPNDKLITSFLEEVRGNNPSEKTNNITEDMSEDSVIMKDKAHALNNNEVILQHNLMGYVLTSASPSMENREINKLQRVAEIYSLRDQVQLLKDQGKTDQEEEVVNLQNQIIEKVGQMIGDFGEAESLIENDSSLEHYTLGNLRDDLTKGEMSYIQKMGQLKLQV